MRKGDRILVLVLLAALLASGAVLWYQKTYSAGTTAVIVSQGKVFDRVDLSRVDQPFEIKVPYGKSEYNILRLEAGRIRVHEATCPNKICVLQGWISDASRPITCLPHDLIIYIEEDEQTDDSNIDGLVY